MRPDALRPSDIPQADALLHIADVLDTGCVMVDQQLVVRGWNRWLESASDLSASAVIGRKLTDVLALADDSIAVRSLRRALAGESVVLAQQFHQFMLPLAPPPGFVGLANMQQSARVVPHKLENGEEGAVALVQDVTERVIRERDLNEAKERAESASKAKSEFLAAISHELRTPLTAILGYSDLMQSEIGGPLTEIQHDHLSRITAGTWHLIKIIDEILTFSRVEAKKYEVMLEVLDACDIVRQTAALLQQQAASKGLALVVDLPDTSVVCETDPLKLRQILLNVMGNAIKFTEAGSITVQLTADETAFSCRVRDTGAGIPSRMHNLVFEPFVQADQSATRAKGGTGLGLALSRSLAEMLGGDLTLESSGPGGSVFLLELPRVAVQELRDAHVGDVNAAVR
ncbi:MAG TPA: ATP-binding protein [Longimicrobiales bacterium]|nr:ATP-binding protein [Longimicrobiales bacterium]